jgi:calcineurin-like phosphoesterase family protein
MKIFFTSDTFFGRKLTAIERGFSSDEEMFDTYIENWNKRVGKNDMVYHLGNFAWDPIACESSMIHLNGKINFLSGQYDSHLPEMSLIKLGRHSIISHQIAIIPNINCIISHWPLLDWIGKEEDYIHVHGGTQSTNLEDGYRFNANVSNWNNAPIEFDFFKELIESNKQ